MYVIKLVAHLSTWSLRQCRRKDARGLARWVKPHLDTNGLSSSRPLTTLTVAAPPCLHCQGVPRNHVCVKRALEHVRAYSPLEGGLTGAPENTTSHLV